MAFRVVAEINSDVYYATQPLPELAMTWDARAAATFTTRARAEEVAASYTRDCDEQDASGGGLVDVTWRVEITE